MTQPKLTDEKTGALAESKLDEKTGRVFSSTADLVWPRGHGEGVLPDARPGSFRLMVVRPD